MLVGCAIEVERRTPGTQHHYECTGCLEDCARRQPLMRAPERADGTELLGCPPAT